MGATTFAFLPARHVLIAEGNSDAMLYPTLFREACGDKNLQFQVAPGLASISPDRFPQLLSEGGTVAFIVDGDEPGETYRRQLKAAGVPDSLVFSLKHTFRRSLELEDLVEPLLYAEAVNALLSTFQAPSDKLRRQDIPFVGRTIALEAWCKERRLAPPDKTRVAQLLLDMKSEAAQRAEDVLLLSASKRIKMGELVRQIKTVLGTVHSSSKSRSSGAQ